MLIFIPTSLIHNQSEVHAKPNENDSGWQSFLVLFVLLCLSLHFSVCPSSQGSLTLIDSLVEPRGASIIFRERLMGSCPVYLMREGSRARSSTSRWQSLFFIPTLSQTNAKKNKQVSILQLCCFSLMRDANIGWSLWSDDPYLIYGCTMYLYYICYLPILDLKILFEYFEVILNYQGMLPKYQI